jgi:iron uptake system component EfeO
MPPKGLPWLALGAAAVLGLAGCGSGSSSSGTSGGSAGKHTLHMTISDDGCSPAKATVPTGPVTVDVVNSGSSSVTELELLNRGGIILGERENVVPGISGSFTLDIQPGAYTLSCPNGKHDTAALTVTGTAHKTANAASAKLLARATSGYSGYVVKQSGILLTQTKQFVAALRSGDLARAQALFGPARSHYEAIEPVAESFGNLDPAIDARANDVVAPAAWTGFHRIEQILWVKHTTAGTGPLATRLLRDVTTLDRRVRTLRFQPAQLANGGVELLNEVANSKITGEEDRYSHTDLSDFAANLEGARVAFQLLRPALVQGGDGALATTLDTRFAAVSTALAKYRRSTPLGYALYGQLTVPDRQVLSKRVGSLAEPLSTVAAKVA